MEILDCNNKNGNKMGLLGSRGPGGDGRFKHRTTQASPTAEELFEASSLFEADDEISEMIEKMVHSILFDDVLDELKDTIPQTVETNGSPNTDISTEIYHGLTHPQESNSATTRKEADKPDGTESNRISDVLQEMSRERISKCCGALKASILEVCQKRAKESSLNLLNEFPQDPYAYFSNDTCEFLLYIIELFHKEVLEFGNEFVENLLRHFDRSVESFSYGLTGELVGWYDDGFVQDGCELNAEFDEQMREFTNVAEENLMPLFDNKIKRYGGILGKAIEVRLQSEEDIQAAKERNNNSNEVLTELDEAGNGVLGKETGLRLQEAEDPQASKERNTDSDEVATEIDKAENWLLGEESDTVEDPQASKERTNDSDEVSTELVVEENKQNVTNALVCKTDVSAMTNGKEKDTKKIDRKAKSKKYSLKRLWCGVKRVFCCFGVAEGNERE